MATTWPGSRRSKRKQRHRYAGSRYETVARGRWSNIILQKLHHTTASRRSSGCITPAMPTPQVSVTQLPTHTRNQRDNTNSSSKYGSPIPKKSLGDSEIPANSHSPLRATHSRPPACLSKPTPKLKTMRRCCYTPHLGSLGYLLYDASRRKLQAWDSRCLGVTSWFDFDFDLILDCGMLRGDVIARRRPEEMSVEGV
jgi:hypothetical protein